jgi:hypothetical protein
MICANGTINGYIEESGQFNSAIILRDVANSKGDHLRVDRRLACPLLTQGALNQRSGLRMHVS